MIALDQNPADVISDLTDKQVQVLDLLLQHKTTKQIARELGIAPSTVDARILAVREKWGTTDRNATARVYAHLLETCEKSPCGFSLLESDLVQSQGFVRELPGSPMFAVADAQTLGRWHMPAGGRPGVLETLDYRFGKAGRIVAIVALALALAALVVLTLSAAEALSNLYVAGESPNPR